MAVGRGIADISCLRQYDVWDPFLYRSYDAGSIIDGESGLSEDDVLWGFVSFCPCSVIARYEAIHALFSETWIASCFAMTETHYICHTLDQGKVLTSLIDHAESFLMSSLADIEDMISLRDRVTGFAVHLLHQWTGSVDPSESMSP